MKDITSPHAGNALAAKLAAVHEYDRRGWPMTPTRGKRPYRDGWEAERLGAEDMAEILARRRKENVGVLLGEPSRWLIDIDLDHPHAIEMADEYLPATDSVFGRAGKLRSHRLYHVTAPVVTQQHRLPKPKGESGEGKMIVELRSTGAQTVFPPSIHDDSGERIEWHIDGEPAGIAPDELSAAVARLADAVRARLGVTMPTPRNNGQTPPADILDRNKIIDRAGKYLAKLPPAVNGENGSGAALRAACELFRFGLTDSEARGLFDDFNARCLPPWNEKEIEHKLFDAREKVTAAGEFGSRLKNSGGGKNRRRKASRTNEGGKHDSRLSIATKEGQTDIANARRLVKLHENKLRFCHPWVKWIVWDDIRWRNDNIGQITTWAKSVADELWREAREADSDKALSFAAKSASAQAVSNMVKLATSEPGVPILPDELDTDGWLFNVRNGTLDLRTGTLRAHNQKEMLTKLAPVTFDTSARCQVWERFLARIFSDDEDLLGYVRRLTGYWLTGLIREQILPIFWGVGANGKTTFLNALMDMLGSDYAMKAASDFLMIKRGDTHPTEKMDLFGKRLVVASETEENRRLAESLVKELTGSERIHGRRVYENSWEFTPSHKLVLSTNHKPIIRGTDHAIWRRLRLVPFSVVIPDHQQDAMLPDKLRAEASGILNWCVAGCLDWQRHGEQPPTIVLSATKGYRMSQDILQTFVDECCLTSSSARTKAVDLYETYKGWCERSGEHADTQRQFGEAMTEHRFERKVSNGTWYLGVGLRSEHPADA